MNFIRKCELRCRGLTLKQYRFADSFVFLLLAVGSSILSEYVYSKMPIKYYYINLSLLVSLILIIRWNLIGALAFAISGIPVMIFRGGDGSLWFQIVYYIISNLSVGLIVFIFRWIDKSKIYQSIFFQLMYLGTVFIILSVTKGLTFILVGENPLGVSTQYLLGESFNMITTIILFLLINKLSDGLIVDMKDYIYKAQGEEK